MLILTRKIGESIIIGEGANQIKITVIATGSQVRLGIVAPKNVQVLREELIERPRVMPPLRGR